MEKKNTDFKQIEMTNSIGSFAPCLTRLYKENTNHGTVKNECSLGVFCIRWVNLLDLKMYFKDGGSLPHAQ